MIDHDPLCDAGQPCTCALIKKVRESELKRIRKEWYSIATQLLHDAKGMLD